jgi:hypothetical protein
MSWIKKFNKFLGYVYTHNLGYYVESSIKREKGGCFIQYVLYKEYMFFGQRIKYFYSYCIGKEELDQSLKAFNVFEYKRRWN